MLPIATATYITPGSLLEISKNPDLLKFVKSIEGSRTELFVPTQADVGGLWKDAQKKTKKVLTEVSPDVRLKALAQVKSYGVEGLKQNQIVEAILAGAGSIVTEQPIVPAELRGVLSEVTAAELPSRFPKVDRGYTID